MKRWHSCPPSIAKSLMAGSLSLLCYFMNWSAESSQTWLFAWPPALNPYIHPHNTGCVPNNRQQINVRDKMFHSFYTFNSGVRVWEHVTGRRPHGIGGFIQKAYPMGERTRAVNLGLTEAFSYFSQLKILELEHVGSWEAKMCRMHVSFYFPVTDQHQEAALITDVWLKMYRTNSSRRNKLSISRMSGSHMQTDCRTKCYSCIF